MTKIVNVTLHILLIFAILISFFKINIVLQRLGPQKGPRSPQCAFMQETIFAILK